MKRKANKQDILNTVFIVDLAENAGIEFEECVSGNFDLRCKCPGKDHKSGNERTPSLYVDSNKNNFYCYGCNASSNVIDFYMLLANVSFGEAFRTLREFAEPSGKPTKTKIKTSNFQMLFQISNFFREQMLLHSNDLKWINNIMKKTDKYIEDIDQYDLVKTRALFDSLKKTFKERYSK